MNGFAIRIASFLTGIAVLAALTGCENPVIVTGVQISTNYTAAELHRYGTGGNELRVDVGGDPFGDGADNTAVAVVNAMQGKNVGVPVAFAVEPKQEAQPASRVVLYVNPRQLIGSETLCAPRGPVTTSPSANGKVTVSGAWCQTNYVITRADARVEEAAGLASEKFQALIAQLTIALFPPQNPHNRTGFGRCQPSC